MTRETRLTVVIACGYLLLAAAIYGLLMQEFRLDDSFITYRYARNVAAGQGLIYNIGENILSTTAPLYAIVLALLSFVIADFHVLGGIFGTLCIAGGAICLFLLTKRLPFWLRGWAGLMYVLATPLWLALGMETALWLMLVLVAVLLAEGEIWLFAGLCMGMAMLSRPDAVLAGALLGLTVLLFSVNQRSSRTQWWRPVVLFGIAAALPVVLFYGRAWQTYGSPFPATLSAKSAQAVVGVTGFGYATQFPEGLWLIVDGLLQQSPLYAVMMILIVIGISAYRRMSSAVTLVIVWGILHFVAYVLLGTAPYRWYYLPMLPGAILLAVYGLTVLVHWLSVRAAMLVAVMPLLASVTSFIFIQNCFDTGCDPGAVAPTIDWKAYRETGEWLAANTPEHALIGVSEVGQIGFYAERRMTDYLGLLQPEVAQMLRRDDLYSWLVDYAPDYLVFQRDKGQTGLKLYNTYIQEDAWFNASYQEVISFDDPRYPAAPISIFERVTEKTPMIAEDADFIMGDIRLESYATERNLSQGDSLRIRLDWEILQPGHLPDELLITVQIGDTTLKSDRSFLTAEWAGNFSTWHSFILSQLFADGEYDLSVTVWSPGRDALTEVAGIIDVRKTRDDPASDEQPSE